MQSWRCYYHDLDDTCSCLIIRCVEYRVNLRCGTGFLTNYLCILGHPPPLGLLCGELRSTSARNDTKKSMSVYRVQKAHFIQWHHAFATDAFCQALNKKTALVPHISPKTFSYLTKNTIVVTGH